MHSFVSAVLVLSLACSVGGLGMLDERNKQDLWVSALERCGDDARDENAELAVKCQEETEKKFASEEGVAGFVACDMEYCACTHGTWANGTCEQSDRCKDDCECMEQCYARQMECSFEHTVRLYASRDTQENACDAVELTKCVRETRGAFVAECKRGMGKPVSFISWMSQPVAQGCDADLVCGSSGVLSVSLAVLVASLAAVLA
eukprot:TRINITY_DN3476_c0_g1_i1.p1 TRINITY_DN3476_c0_g1~~TRINITY_DN3476_c0_g1_i1.p1  ORF type:complete len:204 (+),score=88.45 TRINITY_DN3476_c0_g1_i1:174-785(+)